MNRTLHRGLAASLLGLLFASTAFAGAAPLSGEEIQEVVNGSYPQILECYKEHALKQKRATGEVNVFWVVKKNGSVNRISIDAPGVKGKDLEACIVEEVETWQFREIPGPTEVEYPFLFQRTHAPGAGPQRR